MRITPDATGESPVTSNIRLLGGSGTDHGKTMLVVAREGTFQRTVIFKYPGKTALSEFSTFRKKEDMKQNR